MQLILAYLKEKRQIFGIAVTASALVFLLAFLYNAPIGLAVYFSCLLFFIVLSLVLVGWKQFREKTEELNRALKQDFFIMPEQIGQSTRSEEYYHELLSRLEQAKCELENKTNQQLVDRLEYYTMWVHQIKTPISSLSVLLQVNRDKMDKELNRDMEMELFHIEQYVEMALNYARLNDCTGDLVIVSCSLDDLIKKSIQKYRKVFISKKISMDFRETNLEIVTDEKWFCFVIEQLLSNSLKYTTKGTITIGLEDNLLVVEDTGIGIASEDLPRIFEKGYTGYNGRMDKKASGIGLYLCRKVLDLLGCQIRAESHLGEGTRMLIDFEKSELVID